MEGKNKFETEGGSVINLPDDAKLVARLQRKLEEYEERAKGNDTRPDDTAAKIEVLGSLLRDGSVNLEEVIARVGDKLPVNYIENAFAVTNSYVKIEGLDVAGGTGLPE